jgi:hypothetical protein
LFNRQFHIGMVKKILNRPIFIRLLNWEYWPFHAIYGPVYFYWFWLCLRARSLFFFNTANPGIRNGGFLMESKKEIYNLVPDHFYPPTFYFPAGTPVDDIIMTIQKNKLRFPLIGKPDIGMKGHAVKKLDTENDVLLYSTGSKVDFLIQEFVPYEKEMGIFYYRYPGEKRGHISGIVQKEFLSVTGDGASTIQELLKKNQRTILQLPVLKKTFGNELKRILKKGESRILVPYGNHVRGAKFTDGSHLIDDTFVRTIDEVCRKIQGFYYGRIDIRYHSWEELRLGKNFSIIEINGAGSEPTHIYDPRHSVFFAWKEIIRHWKILWRISRMNHHSSLRPYMSLGSGIRMLKQNSQYVKQIAGEKQRA